MDFEDLIETLTKGSASAVTTLESNVADLNALKKYLDVQTPVGAALRAEIDNNLKKPCVIFVCGSSGDRKSELYRRIYDSYGTKVRFHLDATHTSIRRRMPSGLWMTSLRRLWYTASSVLICFHIHMSGLNGVTISASTRSRLDCLEY